MKYNYLMAQSPLAIGHRRTTRRWTSGNCGPLLAVAETGSATKAAEMLRIVQPAVSRHIRLLEEEFGVELFGRERHGMVLTEAGKTLAEYGRRALQELDRARAEIKPASGTITGTASLGLLPSTCELLAPELVAAIKTSIRP